LANASTVNAPSGKTSEISASPRSLTTPSGSGTIVQMVSYVVKQGDTLESIAQKFSRSGQTVTAMDIRRRNYISNDPAPGTMLLVPTTSSSFGSAAPVISPVPSVERAAARNAQAAEHVAPWQCAGFAWFAF
jgi:LysM repeat protein